MISFNFVDVPSSFLGNNLRQWLTRCLNHARVDQYDLSYIFVTDEHLHKMNVERLNQDSFTDILTFNLTENHKDMMAEIYISYDRVKENSEHYGCTFEEEIKRVMIHGVLHLLGHDDKSISCKENMRRLENEYIQL